MTRLSLSLLGPLEVALDGTPVTGFKYDKVRALLVYLAVEAERPQRREWLAELLWPGLSSRAASSNLRNALMPGVKATLTELSGCDLGEAVLTDADLSAAKLMGTNLRYADMSYAKLDAADFSQADLFFANLHGVSEEATKWSGSSRSTARRTNKKRLQGEKLFKSPAPPPEAS